MRDVNAVFLTGNLGRDPEVRYTNSGEPVASFSVAVNESWTKDGQKKERTNWIRCEAFGKLAEIIRDLGQKGTKVLVQGALRVEDWTDKDGQKRTAVKVSLSGPGGQFQVLKGGRERDERHASVPPQRDEFSSDDNEDSVPF